MIYGLYQSAAGMMVNEYRQNVLANNLANAETIGFKREVASFAERQTAHESGSRDGSTNELMEALSGGTWLARTDTVFKEGAAVRTDNPLDVMISGPGFLRVNQDGQEYLTRDGRMLMNSDGWLVSATDGSAILGEAGQPIRLNPRGGEIAIDSNGEIKQNNVTVARLGLVDVDNYLALRKVGASRFDIGEAKLTRSPAEINQGTLESSGVAPIQELVSMIDSARVYQMNAQMLTMQDQSAGRLINAVANA